MNDIRDELIYSSIFDKMAQFRATLFEPPYFNNIYIYIYIYIYILKM
ncbi:hypothetical protein K7X86_00185 [Candidatus Sulcia muelleri]|nr:hypothetical protein [Candidatus Karelsulcia muelleri]